LAPGKYEAEWSAIDYPSGIYFYRMIASDPSSNRSYSESKKMVLTK
jgi:hypothetical protein